MIIGNMVLHEKLVDTILFTILLVFALYITRNRK